MFRACLTLAAFAASSAFAQQINTGIDAGIHTRADAGIHTPAKAGIDVLPVETAIDIPAPPQLDAKAYLLIDSATGRVLGESNADARLAPASLTKLMTAYVVFGALRDGRLGMDDQVQVSEKAWRMRGSRMFIEVNTRVSVADLLRGLIIQSGNDASVALAEHLAGSEEAFVQLMNETRRPWV